ncbi:hypothetical protein [Luteimonas sp. MC1895]|uniref:hypothetical protein n=1 Tax=Luteimonas sp. MC1895 TaxID=2819513 RepID=UPI001F2B8963|nr:hypothetical protein [Luteimonas sp. MC1895]
MRTPRFPRAARTALLAASLAAATSALVACQDPAARAEAQAAAQREADEAAAGQAAADFDAAYAAENWPLAAAQGDVLLARYPGTAAAERIGSLHAEARAKGNAVREDARLAALWSYNVEAVKGGEQLSAAIFAKENVDSDGSGAKPVRLIFRDHPDWGRSSYLVMQAGDFDCYGACRVAVTVDDAAPERMAANRPKTDEAIAMFIDDEKALWRMIDGAKRLAVEYPVKAGGTRTVEFEVGGLERGRLPAWN